MDRFFSEAGLAGAAPGARLRLDEGETHHARVKRIAPDDRIRVFDAEGREVAARVLAIARAHTDVEVLEAAIPPAAPLVPVTLGLALPKGKRAQAFLEKATELGVAAIFPLVTARTVGGARDAAAAMASDKWRRTTVEAAKQCGVARLPRLLAPRPLEDVLAAPAGGALQVVLDPRPDAPPLRAALAGPPPAAVTLLVGPEGGFAPDEIDAAARAGFRRARLGPTVLRIETAALAAVAAVVVAYE